MDWSFGVKEDTDGHDHDDQTSLTGPRAVVCICMIFASLLSLVPFHPRCKGKKNEPKDSFRYLFFSLSACFAAGMIMTISMLHILPEAHEKYSGVLSAREKELERAEAIADAKSGSEHSGHDDHDSGEGGH